MNFFKMPHDSLFKTLNLCEGTAIESGAACANFDEKSNAMGNFIICVPMPKLEEMKKALAGHFSSWFERFFSFGPHFLNSIT